MSPEACLHRYHPHRMVVPPVFCSRNSFPISYIRNPIERPTPSLRKRVLIMVASPPTSTTITRTRLPASAAALSSPPPLDLTEDNVMQVLVEARAELGQIFDTTVGMTGKVELAELDGPFVKIRLKGRFWHKRSTVLARVGNYLKQRIPVSLDGPFVKIRLKGRFWHKRSTVLARVGEIAAQFISQRCGLATSEV